MKPDYYLPPLPSAPVKRNTRFFWIVTVCSTALGCLFAGIGILAANGAPQEAAAAAVGCLAAVGPYCLARAVDELRRV